MSRSLPALAAVLALAAAPLAHAQAPQIAYGEPHPHTHPQPQPPRPATMRPSDAAARAAAVARRETGESPIAYELYRLSVLLRRAEERGAHGRGHGHGHGHGHRRQLAARVSEQIDQVEDALAGYPGRPPRPLRRALRELEASLAQYGHTFLRMPVEEPTPMPPAPPYPREPVPAQGGLRFEGSFEGMPVFFRGPSAEALFGQCRAELASGHFGGVDDIAIFGVAERNVTSYWGADALCAIVALNGRPEGMHVALAPIEGRVESVPFRVSAPAGAAAHVLGRFLPIALQGENIDDVTVAGQAFRNGPGFWSVEETIRIVLGYSQGQAPGASPRAAVYVR